MGTKDKASIFSPQSQIAFNQSCWQSWAIQSPVMSSIWATSGISSLLRASWPWCLFVRHMMSLICSPRRLKTWQGRSRDHLPTVCCFQSYSYSSFNFLRAGVTLMWGGSRGTVPPWVSLTSTSSHQVLLGMGQCVYRQGASLWMEGHQVIVAAPRAGPWSLQSASRSHCLEAGPDVPAERLPSHHSSARESTPPSYSPFVSFTPPLLSSLHLSQLPCFLYILLHICFLLPTPYSFFPFLYPSSSIFISSASPALSLPCPPSLPYFPFLTFSLSPPPFSLQSFDNLSSPSSSSSSPCTDNNWALSLVGHSTRCSPPSPPSPPSVISFSHGGLTLMKFPLRSQWQI